MYGVKNPLKDVIASKSVNAQRDVTMQENRGKDTRNCCKIHSLKQRVVLRCLTDLQGGLHND